MIFRSTISAVLLFTSSLAMADSPEETVSAYFDGFNGGRAAAEMIERYWHPEVTIVMADGVLQFAAHDETAAWLEGLQEEIKSQGWRRSEILERRVCALSPTNALYSVRFKRVFESGEEFFSGGVYLMLRTDRWRIAGLVFAGADSILDC